MTSQHYLKILQITDTHIFRDDRGKLLGIQTDTSMTDVIAKARAQFDHADVILCTGDLVHDRSEVGYQHFKDIFSQFSCPVLVLPGNHDDSDLLYRCLSDGNLRSNLHNVIGGWQFISLNSAVVGKDHGFIKPDELVALDKALAQHPNMPALICLHHQPVDVGSKWMDAIGVENKAELWEVLDRHTCVKGVVWGHIHQHFEATHHAIKLFGTPSTCVQFKPETEGFAVDTVPPGYRWLTLADDGGINTGVVRIDNIPVGLESNSWGYE